MTVLSAIPSPTQGVWELGPLPIRAYALCIIAGIAAAVAMTERRWVARGGAKGEVLDIAVWAVPFGIVGGRLYHVLSSPRPYFGEGGDPLRALAIWEGGLGIWGAIALGGVGAWIACRRRGIPLPAFADALAPGLLVAQAIGRLGNWFNNELYGGPTDLPWALRIYEWDGTGAVVGADGQPVVLGTFHPAFLYELLWNLAAAAVVIWADRRFRLSHGRAFAIWEGGLGIWGAIALGGVGAWIACRRRGIPLPAFGDALAPGLLVAQAIGRLGNWFNNELYGRATDLPWALTIYEWTGTRAVVGPDGQPLVLGTFHPTFLYELLWNLAAAAVVIGADRRFRLSHGRAFALYVALYCAGRLWIELLRTDPAETIAGIRLNVYTAVVVGLLAVAYLVWQRGRPREVVTRGRDAADAGNHHVDPAGTAPAVTPGTAETRDGEDTGEDGRRRHPDG